MFLPENSEFPPAEWIYINDKWKEYEAWYSSDPERILKYNMEKLSIEDIRYDNSFWGQLQKETYSNAVKVPSAADIAAASAGLLFSEPANFMYDKKSQQGERIDNFFEENGFDNFLLESAEICSAISGCFLKLDIDTRLSQFPIISVMTPLQAFPTFLRGRLWEVLFYRTVKIEKNTTYYRLFENRKREGKNLTIEYKLYKGTNDKVGNVVDLNFLEETANLNLKPEIYNNIDGLGVVYIPNLRPNKLMLGSPLGANDFGISLGMMDSLDLAWNSWIRDIELGMGQIFIDEELLIKEEQSIFGDNKTMLNKFSKFEKCFINLNLSQSKFSGDNVKPIECSQFEMRVDEHLKSCNYFWSQIVSMCGYSPATFGLNDEGNAQSGTALKLRQRASFLTREKKARYWQFAIKQILRQMQIFDNIINRNVNYTPDEIKVELEDSIIVDTYEQSNMIKNLDQARAISTYMKVKLQHNDWSEQDIEEEVKRIYDEENMNSTNIFDEDNPINLDNVKNENNDKNNSSKNNEADNNKNNGDNLNEK